MMSLSGTQLVVGLMLVILGVVTFYLVPESFINQNLPLFFFIFNMLLIMIIFGMVFLCIMIFPYFEKLIKWVVIHTCCCKDRHLDHLI
jgi:hypothetical protein